MTISLFLRSTLKAGWRWVLIFGLAWGWAGGAAHAQWLGAHRGPSVMKVSEVFEGDYGRLAVGDHLRFKIKNDPKISKLISAKIQVRIFTLVYDELQPRHVMALDDCEVFISALLKLQPQAGNELIGQALDYEWLNVTDSLRTILPGRYLLVFEEDGPDTTEFRIKRQDLVKYFESGFVLTLESRAGVSLEAVKAAYLERQERFAKFRLQIDANNAKAPCYTYKQITVAQREGDLSSQMEICKAPIEPEPS